MNEIFGSPTATSINPNMFSGDSGSIDQSYLKTWQPNTQYYGGDIVLATYNDCDWGEVTKYYKCNITHISSNVAYINDDAMHYSKWDYIRDIDVINSVYAQKAARDSENNIIHETYATKNELSVVDEKINQMATAGLKREIVEGELPCFKNSNSNTIYMTKVNSSLNNIYNEYLMVGIESFDTLAGIESVYNVFHANETDVTNEVIYFEAAHISKIEYTADGIDVYFYSYLIPPHRVSITNNDAIQSILQIDWELLTFDFTYANNALHNVDVYSRELIGSTAVDLTKYVTKASLGDIETALDNIIELQNSIIGGE